MDGVVALNISYLYLIHVVVITIRVGAALMFAPIWGYSGFPSYLRIILIFSIGVAVASVTPFNPTAYANPTLLLPAEFLIGTLLAMGIRIAFAGLQFGSHMISHHLGYSMVQSIDPATQNRSTLMSGFLSMFAYVMILSADQHHTILRTLAESYKVFPAGTTVQASQWFDSLMHAAGQVFVIGWRIALPVFIATLLLEVAMSFIARMHPQITLMVVTAPLKIVVGLVVLGASLAFIPRAFDDAFNLILLKK